MIFHNLNPVGNQEGFRGQQNERDIFSSKTLSLFLSAVIWNRQAINLSTENIPISYGVNQLTTENI